MHWNEFTPSVRAARAITARLHAAHYEALWVGGCIRDRLLGLDPADVDIATNARPETVLALFPHSLSVGAQFGVVIVIEEGVQTEVATYRTDGEYHDGRHPTAVTFGTAQEDASRRDFTINALFYDPARDEILDYVGGRADLDAHVLRAIGDPARRFEEDALRLLRAVRFAVRFGLAIEPSTWDAIRRHAAGIERVSPERIRDELTRIFTGPTPGHALHLLDEAGLLEPLLPEVAALKGVPQPEAFHPEGDVFVHTALALDALPPAPSATLAFATLLHDVGKPATLEFADRIRFNEHADVGAGLADEVCKRLRFSNADRRRIVALVAGHMRFMSVTEMRPNRLRQFLAQDGFDEHAELHRADCLASHGNAENYEFCKRKREEFAREDAERALVPEPLLGGDTLIALGYRPGRRMGEILHAVREAQLDGELAGKEEALAWVAERFPLPAVP